MVMRLEQYMNNFNYATKELELKSTLTELQTEKVDGIKMYSHTFEDGTNIHIIPDKEENVLAYHFADQSILELYQNEEKMVF